MLFLSGFESGVELLDNLYRVLKVVGEKVSGGGVVASAAVLQGIPAQSFILLSSVAMLVSTTILVAGSWLGKVLLSPKGTDVQKENTTAKSVVESANTVVQAEVQPTVTQPILRGGDVQAMLCKGHRASNSLHISSTPLDADVSEVCRRDGYDEAMLYMEHKNSNSSQIPPTRRRLKSAEPWINAFLNPNKGPGYVRQYLESVNLDCFPAIAQKESSSALTHIEQADDNSHWVKLYNEQEAAYEVKNAARAKL